jgi:hypothetical protein
MSETDVETQLKLQQFSPQVTAMVIDSQTGTTGFFRADSKTKGSIPIRSEPLMTEATGPPASMVAQAMYPQTTYAPAPSAGISTRTLILAVLLITLAISGAIIALIYYASPGGGGYGNLTIKHTPPVGPFTIGNGMIFDANVTGSNLQNVTLAYRVIERSPSGRGGFVFGDLVRVPMLLKAAQKDIYSYSLPPSEVSGVYIQYYISAFDSASPPNVVRTDVYVLTVGDFDWHDDKTDVTVIRTIQTQVEVPIDAINGFNRPVTIKITTPPPLGVRIIAASTSVTPPTPAVLTITSTDNAQIAQKYDIEIDAVYAARAVQIIRSTTLSLTVTDFEIDVNPLFQQAKRCTASYESCKPQYAHYTFKETINEGFTAASGITVTLSGLPDRTHFELILQDQKIAADGTETLTYDLQVEPFSGAKTDKYVLQLAVTADLGGGRKITHTISNIQLEIID